MKKTLWKSACLYLCIILLLMFCGCEMTDLSDETNTTTQSATTTTIAPTTTTVTTTTTTTVKTTVTTATTTEKITTTSAPTTIKKTTVQQVAGNGVTVYTTPSGERYHLDPQCGGKNSGATDKETAVRAGRTPCKKCAQ